MDKLASCDNNKRKRVFLVFLLGKCSFQMPFLLCRSISQINYSYSNPMDKLSWKLRERHLFNVLKKQTDLPNNNMLQIKLQDSWLEITNIGWYSCFFENWSFRWFKQMLFHSSTYDVNICESNSCLWSLWLARSLNLLSISKHRHPLPRHRPRHTQAVCLSSVCQRTQSSL